MVKTLLWALIGLGMLWFVAQAAAAIIPYLMIGVVLFVVGGSTLKWLSQLGEASDPKDRIIDQ